MVCLLSLLMARFQDGSTARTSRRTMRPTCPEAAAEDHVSAEGMICSQPLFQCFSFSAGERDISDFLERRGSWWVVRVCSCSASGPYGPGPSQSIGQGSFAPRPPMMGGGPPGYGPPGGGYGGPFPPRPGLFPPGAPGPGERRGKEPCMTLMVSGQEQQTTLIAFSISIVLSSMCSREESV